MLVLTMETLTELLEEQLKDLYSAENQLLKALPKMAKKAFTPELKQGFLTHLEETKGHVDRLLQATKLLGIKPTGKVCAAMKGLCEEGQEVIEEEEGKNPAIDGALIAAAQRVEHYEIAAYGTVSTLAELLGQSEVAKLLKATLTEEKATDQKLTAVAEENVYPNAQKTEDDAPAEEEDEAPKKSGKQKPPSKAAASKGGKKSAKKKSSR